jgi:two-component system response regulator MprA
MMLTCERCGAELEALVDGCPSCRRAGDSAAHVAFVADEDRPFRALLVSELTRLGFRVEVFSGGDGLLDRIREERPALLLANVYLRGMLGVELCENIKAQQELPTRVILIGAIFRPDRYRARPESHYGADGYLEEGLPEGKMESIVRSALSTPQNGNLQRARRQ